MDAAIIIVIVVCVFAAVGLLFVYLRFLCLKEERQEREDFNAPPPVNPELGQSAGMIIVEALPITRSQEAEMASAPQATVVEP